MLSVLDELREIKDKVQDFEDGATGHHPTATQLLDVIDELETVVIDAEKALFMISELQNKLNLDCNEVSDKTLEYLKAYPSSFSTISFIALDYVDSIMQKIKSQK